MKNINIDTNNFKPFPQWVTLSENFKIPLYMRAVKPKNKNLWHVEIVTIVKRKRVLFKGMQVLLDWYPYQNYYFYTQDKAEAFIRHVFANNARTSKRIEGDILTAKYFSELRKTNAK